MNEYLCFDIGGTNLKYALISEKGEIKEKGSVATPKDNLNDFLTELFKVADQYQEKFSGIAISSPGKIDRKNKIIHFGGALPFLDGLNVQKEIGDKYHVPVSVENDGKAATLCELWFGELKDIDSGALLTLGTGVGCGVIVNDQLLRGVHFQAGELSYMILDHEIAAKNMQGCAGFMGSAVNMVRTINRKLENIDYSDGKAAFAAIKAGNPVAKKIFEEYCRSIAIIILNLQTVVDSRKIVIGGGISSQELLIKGIKQQFKKLIGENPMLEEQITTPTIVAAKFHNDANLLGALYALLSDGK